VAESSADIFLDAAISEIYRYASGSPRLINKACTHYLVYGQQQHKNIIDHHITHSTPKKMSLIRAIPFALIRLRK
jgi:hypothetical protein